MGKMQLKKGNSKTQFSEKIDEMGELLAKKIRKKEKKKEKYLTLKMQRNVTIFGTKTL